jgi:hypothetical protein
MLNFTEQTGCGAVMLVWSFPLKGNATHDKITGVIVLTVKQTVTAKFIYPAKYTGTTSSTHTKLHHQRITQTPATTTQQALQLRYTTYALIPYKHRTAETFEAHSIMRRRSRGSPPEMRRRAGDAHPWRRHHEKNFSTV